MGRGETLAATGNEPCARESCASCASTKIHVRPVSSKIQHGNISVAMTACPYIPVERPARHPRVRAWRERSRRCRGRRRRFALVPAAPRSDENVFENFLIDRLVVPVAICAVAAASRASHARSVTWSIAAARFAGERSLLPDWQPATTPQNAPAGHTRPSRRVESRISFFIQPAAGSGQQADSQPDARCRSREQSLLGLPAACRRLTER